MVPTSHLGRGIEVGTVAFHGCASPVGTKGKIMDRFASVRVFVADMERSAPRLPKLTKQKLLQIGVASAFATGMLAAVPSAQARITQIQILTKPKTIAFGGYSFPGVGQYEVITGIATGEVNPNNLQNSVITDIQLAPTNANGNVVYQHNFYILKPLNLSLGNHKMMYEPSAIPSFFEIKESGGVHTLSEKNLIVIF
jgi:hypothetical protein